MRLTVICNEPPYPPITGGSADVWNRLKAFKENGIYIQLICWESERLGFTTVERIAAMKNIVDDLIICRIRFDFLSLFLRFCHLVRYPSHVGSRILKRRDFKSVFASVDQFHPDAIWLDNIYGGVLALELFKTLRLPIFVRSHNIEHYYMKQQFLAENKPIRKVALLLTNFHLKSFEFEILKKSKLFYDISVDDLSFWIKLGLQNGRWLPPLVSIASDVTTSAESVKYDVGFLGNLNTPNNIEGVAWFIENVLPRLLKERPDIRIAIAGSKPEEIVRQLCLKQANILFIENPKSAFGFYSSASILINPALRGSGVNVKSVEMLFTEKPVVTTSVGVKGLPDGVKRCFSIADTPERMAEEILAFLKEPEVLTQDRQNARRYFLPDAINQVIHDMEAVLGKEV